MGIIIYNDQGVWLWDDAMKSISPESFFWKCAPGLSQMHTFMLDGNHVVGFNLTNKRNPG